MADFIFINPSPNMEIAAGAVASTGRTVRHIYTKDFVQKTPKNIWTFIDGKVTKIEEKKSFTKNEPHVSMMKKPFFFFTGRFNNYLKGKLGEINPIISEVNFSDYMLLSAPLWRGAGKPIELSDMTFDEVIKKYPNSKIVASKFPYPGGKHYCVRWRTDYDIQEAMGDNYFFCFDGKIFHGIYQDNGELVSISESREIDWLKRMNPAFNKFSFQKISVESYHQNVNPWIQKYSSGMFLLNDYSWQGVSVRLPDDWTKAVKRYFAAIKIK